MPQVCFSPWILGLRNKNKAMSEDSTISEAHFSLGITMEGGQKATILMYGDINMRHAIPASQSTIDLLNEMAQETGMRPVDLLQHAMLYFHQRWRPLRDEEPSTPQESNGPRRVYKW